MINTKRFEGEYFDNTIIIFRKEEPYNGPYQESAKLFDKEQIDEVIEICERADLVVLYDLDVLKSQIAIALPKGVKIAWRFFGYELYKRMKNEILSQRSQAFLPDNQLTPLEDIFKNLLRPVYHKFKYGGSPDDLFHRAINRIDYILIICKQEHTYLSQYWGNLPVCIELSIGTGLFGDEVLKPDMNIKADKIVIGNSRNINNNHLDVIDEIEKATNKEKYRFELLFNYGTEGDYAHAVRKAVQGKPYFHIIEEFMPKEEFDTFYDDVSALVINGYRQMAMGNIFHALKHGVKIYLNEKNIMMDWLLENGIKVYSISSLSSDMAIGNIRLDQQTANTNLECLYDLYKSYSHEEFQKNVYDRL